MARNILLVEPGYETKFPPMGLMKISTYHKKQGDRVRFIKGISEDAAYEYWDRIYVSTLFTYHWKTTIETIRHYKNLVRGDTSRIVVGGILATLMPEELWNATGIYPVTGVLNAPDPFRDGTSLVVEEMIPDYELFNESNEKYTLIKDSYFGYSTRGCVHKCDFCGVPELEPKFIDYKGIKPYVNKLRDLYGEKEHLVLFDNNILASKKFEQIIQDIIDLGFQSGAKTTYQNKQGRTISKSRRVDFNQGTDARLIVKRPRYAKMLSKIAIHPLRIAFDSIALEDTYVKSVLLAADNGIQHLSNYILYNHTDTPHDFWKRLKININLNKKHGLQIYSFPMKYIPINAKDRSYISEPNWNWFFIRNVQRILNVLKGTVMTGEEFFYRAFGENEEEFITILHMPEHILMYRGSKPKIEETTWLRKFGRLSSNEKKELLDILSQCRTRAKLSEAVVSAKNRKLKTILNYYLPSKHEQKTLPLFEHD